MNVLRQLPSVDQVLRNLKLEKPLPQELVVSAIRAALARRRQALKDGNSDPQASPIEREVEGNLQSLLAPSLRTVINASGVVLHTNLGRAPLPKFDILAGYTNLEYDLAEGKRGKRDVHLAGLLECLLQRPAIVVNNNAAAVYLVLSELAAGSEVIISRGELIEIGDGFRIPDIMARAGVMLREIGTTNRTAMADYRSAVNEKTRLILRVHPSNFHVSGFTERPALKELVELGREIAVPVFEDLGSGCVVDLRGQGIDEPLVADSISAGVNVLSFSCDKLLGGPQTGIIAGDAELVARIRRNPMYRALRVDKLIVQALQTTLLHLVRKDWQKLPALRMILATPEEIRKRAEQLSTMLEGVNHALEQTASKIGGGSTPNYELSSWAIVLRVQNAAAFEKRLRRGQLPVIARIEHDKVLLDLRTVNDGELEALAAAIRAASEN